jgi:uncharacterized protein YegL
MKKLIHRRLVLAIFVVWGYGALIIGCEQTPPDKKPEETPIPKPTEAKAPAKQPELPLYQLDLSQIPQLTSETIRPNTVGLFFCLDTSGSMGNAIGGQAKIDISKEAMQQVFNQIATYIQSHPERKVEVGLCSFATTASLRQPLKAFDQSSLEQVIQPLQPSGGTAIGDAIILALKEVLKSGVETKAILVMTDGENNRGVPPHQVVEAIKQDRNNQQRLTADIDVFLIAFDINAAVFDAVKKAGAFVVESRDQKSLESVLSSVVEQVLLEAR